MKNMLLYLLCIYMLLYMLYMLSKNMLCLNLYYQSLLPTPNIRVLSSVKVHVLGTVRKFSSYN